jgi:transposase
LRTYWGIDSHRDYLVAYRWAPDTPESQQVRRFRLLMTPRGLEELTTQLDRESRVALEVSGNAFELYDVLSAYAGQVLVANPLEMRRLGSGRHTDRVDAERLAKMLALGTLPTVWVPPKPVRAIRRLLQYRERLASQRTRLVNQAKAVLRRRGVVLGRGDPRRALGSAELDRWPEEEQSILLSPLRLLGLVEQEIQAVEAEIAARLQDNPGFRHLLTIPGVSLLTAAVIWAAIGDPHRFRSPKQMTRYAGLDPSVFQSGQADRRGHISKNGSRELRRHLVEAAQVIARVDSGPLGAFYRRKAQRIGPKKALVALARKLLIVAWRMLQRGEDYRGNHQELTRHKELLVTRVAQDRRDWKTVREEVVPHRRAARPTRTPTAA